MSGTMDNNGVDDKCHVSTSGVPDTPSVISTENTFLSPTAKQTYFKENKVQIPHTEKVCVVKHNEVFF